MAVKRSIAIGKLRTRHYWEAKHADKNFDDLHWLSMSLGWILRQLARKHFQECDEKKGARREALKDGCGQVATDVLVVAFGLRDGNPDGYSDGTHDSEQEDGFQEASKTRTASNESNAKREGQDALV